MLVANAYFVDLDKYIHVHTSNFKEAFGLLNVEGTDSAEATYLEDG